MSKLLTRCAVGLLAMLCAAVLIVDPIDAARRNRSRDIVQSYFEGVDEAGNDTFGSRIHTGRKNRRMRNYLARHQTAEEGVYGPGDQSTVWDRQINKRLEPRSDVRSGRRPALRGAASSYSMDFEYDDCPTCGGW